MSTRLFVGGLSWGTTDDQLRDLFAKIGTVVSAKVITDKFTGRSKGFGFVEMSTPEEAEKAVKELNNTNFDNRPITVNEARPMVPRDDNSSQRFSRDGGDRKSFRRNDR